MDMDTEVTLHVVEVEVQDASDGMTHHDHHHPDHHDHHDHPDWAGPWNQ